MINSQSNNTSPEIPATAPISAAHPRLILPWWKQPLFISLLLFFLTFAAFAVSIKASYTWSDSERIMGGSISDPLLNEIKNLPNHGLGLMARLSFWIESMLWGFRPSVSHLLNTVMHSASVIILYRLLIRMKSPAPWVAAGLFAVSPVNIESVAWLSNRGLVLGMFFSLISMTFFFKSETLLGGDPSKKKSRAAGFIACVLALLSNGVFGIMPAAYYAYLKSTRGAAKPSCDSVSKPFKFSMLILCPLAIVVGILPGVVRALPAGIAEGSFLPGLLLAPFLAAEKILFPGELLFVYPSIEKILTIPFFVGTALVVLLLFFIIKLRNSGVRPLIGFYLIAIAAGWLNFIGTTAYSSSLSEFSGRDSWFANSMLYIACIPVFLAVATVFSYLRQTTSGFLMTITIWIVFAVFCFQNWGYARNFRSAEELIIASVKQNPDSKFLLANTSQILTKRGQYEEAYPLLQKLKTEYPENSHYSFMTAELQRLRGDAEAAIPEYHNALKLNPESGIALQRLGDAYRNLGKTTEAAAAYKAALEKDKTNVDAGGSLADIYDRSGATTDSLALYPLLVEQKKSVPIFRIRYARALLKSGKKSEAKTQAEEALRIDPNNRQAMEIMDEAGK